MSILSSVVSPILIRSARALRHLYCALALAIGAWLPLTAIAADWPTGPIHLVVSFAPGAGPDVVSRLIADDLSADLGQPILVENRPGAGGRIAINEVKQAAPDGLTLFVASHRFTANPALYQSVDYDPLRDFEPVIQTVSGIHLLVVNADLGIRSQSELTARLKAHPGEYNFASGGMGSLGNLAGELYKHQAGVDAVHIPFRGPAEAIKSVIAGETQFAFLTSNQSVPNVKSGRLIGLSVTGDERSPLFPDLPTIQEAGLPDFNLKSAQGVVAPAGTPPEIIQRLNQALGKALNKPKTVATLEGLGMSVTTGSPEAYGAFLKNEVTRWADLAREAGISLD